MTHGLNASLFDFLAQKIRIDSFSDRGKQCCRDVKLLQNTGDIIRASTGADRAACYHNILAGNGDMIHVENGVRKYGADDKTFFHTVIFPLFSVSASA